MLRVYPFAVLCFTVFSEQTITDERLEYTITLPDNWVRDIEDSTHHSFYDTTGTYESIVALDCYDFGADTLYATIDEWTRANFIAYELTIDADPFSALVYYDTISVKQNGTLWAADALTYFFDAGDGFGDWAEYIRFTANGTLGYELYAIGPLEDMEANVGLYLAIIEGITLKLKPGAAIKKGIPTYHISNALSSPIMLNLQGRKIHANADRNFASQMVVSRYFRRFILK